MPSARITSGHYRRSGSQPSLSPLLIIAVVVIWGIGQGGVAAVPLWLWILIGVTVTAVSRIAIYLLVKQIRREDLQLQSAEEAAELQKEIDAQKLADLKTVTPWPHSWNSTSLRSTNTTGSPPIKPTVLSGPRNGPWDWACW